MDIDSFENEDFSQYEVNEHSKTFYFHYEVTNSQTGEKRVCPQEIPAHDYEYARGLSSAMLDEGYPTHHNWTHREMTPDEVNVHYENEEKRIIALGGKTLVELAPLINGRLQDVVTVTDDMAAICWCDDGTLCYASYYDGSPNAYYAPHTDFANNKEDFTSIERFVTFLRTVMSGDRELFYLLDSPVWKVSSSPSSLETTVTEFNDLLGDIQIDL